MINIIHSDGKIWERRSKKLISGEIECPRCGGLKYFSNLLDKHFTEVYICNTCKKELNADKPKSKPKSKPKKKSEIRWAVDCPHKPFFKCKSKRECQGCYYNPSKKIALVIKDPSDPKKTPTHDWFYGNKAHVKKALRLLNDIKNGKGLMRGGSRYHFKYAKKDEDLD